MSPDGLLAFSRRSEGVKALLKCEKLSKNLKTIKYKLYFNPSKIEKYKQNLQGLTSAKHCVRKIEICIRKMHFLIRTLECKTYCETKKFKNYILKGALKRPN